MKRPLLASLLPLATVLSLAGCGGGGGSSAATTVTFPPPPASLVQVSAATPFGTACNDAASQSGTLYLNATVEPYVAVNPTNALNVIGVWQQDRWSNGGAQGLIAAASFDGGGVWSRDMLPTAVCAGGTAANGGDYQRASDPWVSFSPSGVAYAISLSFSGTIFAQGSTSAMLVTRSTDGGQTWSNPITLIKDGSQVLNDKESITADPTNASYVYAVWDQIDPQDYGPTWFSRTTDGGQSWDAARMIYDPGQNSTKGNQTLGNQIVVLASGGLLDMFTEIDYSSASYSAAFRLIRSSDHGTTWSGPTTIAKEEAVGTRDPQTGQVIRDGAGIADIAVGPGDELAMVWQDARFSGGQRDGIAFSRSTDGGQSWSLPVEINGDPAVQAFTPSVTILGDGTIAVTYYDLRDNTSDPTTLPTDYWITESSDNGATWHEVRLTGPFNLDLAPDAEGLFLGDYQGLAAGAAGPVPLFAQTVSSSTGPTDIFALKPGASPLLLTSIVRGYVASTGSAMAPTPAFRRRISENLRRLLQRHSRPHRIPPPSPR